LIVFPLVIPLSSGAREPKNDLERDVKANFRRYLSTALLRDFGMQIGDCGFWFFITITLDIGKPVIAAINGSAIAGGLEIVLGTDIRVAVDGAKFGLQEVRWGLLAAGGGTVRLPRQLAYPIGMEMLLTGDLVYQSIH
jgi:enoyl-CoA hydratase